MFGNSVNSLFAINPSGSLRWRFTAQGPVYSPVTDNSGNICFAGGKFLYSLTPSGVQRWTYPVSIMASPSISADGTIYVGSTDSYLYAISSSNGVLKWRSVGGPFYSSPAIAADGTIYIGSDNFNMYAFTPTGLRKWAFKADGQIKASPAIGGDGTVYLGTTAKGFYAITPGGIEKWRSIINGGVTATAVIGNDGSVYVGSGLGVMYAFDSFEPLRNGSIVFETYQGSTCASGTLIQAGGNVLGVCIAYSSTSSYMYYNCADDGKTVTYTYMSWPNSICSGPPSITRPTASALCDPISLKKAHCSNLKQGWVDYSFNIWKEFYAVDDCVPTVLYSWGTTEGVCPSVAGSCSNSGFGSTFVNCKAVGHLRQT